MDISRPKSRPVKCNKLWIELVKLLLRNVNKLYLMVWILNAPQRPMCCRFVYLLMALFGISGTLKKGPLGRKLDQPGLSVKGTKWEPACHVHLFFHIGDDFAISHAFLL